MPIQKIGSVEPLARKTRAVKNYKDKDKFVVVGIEQQRTLLHNVKRVDLDGSERLEAVQITGEVTFKELKEINVNVQDWLERGLIEEYDKYRPGDFHRLDEKSYKGKIDVAPV
jgi:hypothetical protein